MSMIRIVVAMHEFGQAVITWSPEYGFNQVATHPDIEITTEEIQPREVVNVPVLDMPAYQDKPRRALQAVSNRDDLAPGPCLVCNHAPHPDGPCPGCSAECIGYVDSN